MFSYFFITDIITAYFTAIYCKESACSVNKTMKYVFQSAIYVHPLKRFTQI